MSIPGRDNVVRDPAGADKALLDGLVAVSITKCDLSFLDTCREDDAVRARGAVHAWMFVEGGSPDGGRGDPE